MDLFSLRWSEISIYATVDLRNWDVWSAAKHPHIWPIESSPIATIQTTIHRFSFAYQPRCPPTMSDRKQFHIGVFIPSASAAQLLDTACIDLFCIGSYEYLSPLPIVPKEITSLAPEVKISYIGSQKAGKVLEFLVSFTPPLTSSH